MGLWEALLRHQQLSGLHKVRPPPPNWGGGPPQWGPYGVGDPPHGVNVVVILGCVAL